MAFMENKWLLTHALRTTCQEIDQSGEYYVEEHLHKPALETRGVNNNTQTVLATLWAEMKMRAAIVTTGRTTQMEEAHMVETATIQAAMEVIRWEEEEVIDHRMAEEVVKESLQVEEVGHQMMAANLPMTRIRTHKGVRESTKQDPQRAHAMSLTRQEPHQAHQAQGGTLHRQGATVQGQAGVQPIPLLTLMDSTTR